MKVLVTGASGHPATNTILHLVEAGYSAAAYLRNKNKFLLAEGSAAIVNSPLKGKNGECYLLANKNLSYKEFFIMLGRSLNKKLILFRLTLFLLILLGIIGELLKLLGINNSLFMTNVGIVRTNNYYTGEKALKELGISYRPI